jgi:hypothetical protein
MTRLLRHALDCGELAEVLADWRQRFSGPFLYFPSRNMPTRCALRRFHPQGWRESLGVAAHNGVYSDAQHVPRRASSQTVSTFVEVPT